MPTLAYRYTTLVSQIKSCEPRLSRLNAIIRKPMPRIKSDM